MGFLNNTTVTVDAILTKKGRELLAQGTEAFNITKFALSDDEVDYNLWDVSHPNGSDYYGAVIENMPLLEAIPDENHVMRYKLVTLPKSTPQMAVIKTVPTAPIIFSEASDPAIDITVHTDNITDHSYTFILHDQSVCSMTGGQQAGSSFLYMSATEASNSKTVTGVSGEVSIGVGSGVNVEKSTQLVIVGNDTGATTSITINNNYVV